jgi:hypothetical protein
VATNQHYTGLTRTNGTNGTGSHTFYFLGRKGCNPPSARLSH